MERLAVQRTTVLFEDTDGRPFFVGLRGGGVTPLSVMEHEGDLLSRGPAATTAE